MTKRLALLAFLLPAILPATLLRIEVAGRSDVLDGKPFGSSGPYERITGRAFFAVDPNLPANKIIADIARAPRNENGLVEFSADIYCLKPRDPKNGNHNLIFEVSNRGGKGMLWAFNLAHPNNDPRAAADFGDAFLLEQGYTILWLGWEFDVPPAPTSSTSMPPLSKASPASSVPNSPPTTKPPASPSATVPRSLTRSSTQAIPASPSPCAIIPKARAAPSPATRWHIENATRIVSPSGFDPGRIYELAYTAQDSPLAGLGPAAVRDVVSFFNYGIDNDTLLGDQSHYIKRAYAFGISQSGRFLRTFLYYGFNRDEKGRRVFDGVMADVAGAGGEASTSASPSPRATAIPS